jgi:protein-tyrosine-phosphatase
MVNKVNILFVCKYNIFRSKVAEAYFKKINKNKKFKAKSAGIFSGAKKKRDIIAECKELGLRIKGKPKGVSIKLLEWMDILVIVADDVPKEIFKYNGIYPKKTLQWEIRDVFSIDEDIPAKRKRAIQAIKKEVGNLVKNLEER